MEKHEGSAFANNHVLPPIMPMRGLSPSQHMTVDAQRSSSLHHHRATKRRKQSLNVEETIDSGGPLRVLQHTALGWPELASPSKPRLSTARGHVIGNESEAGNAADKEDMATSTHPALSGVSMRTAFPTSAALPSPYVRRKRAVAACQFCRERKTKCDNARPVCGSCRRHQARCVYADGSEADGLQVGLDEAATRHREVLQRLDDIRNLLADSSSSPAAGRSNAESEIDAARGHSEQPSGSAGARPLEQSASWDPPIRSPSPPSDPTAYLRYTKCESLLKWPILSAVIDKEDAAIDSFIFDAFVPGDGNEGEADCSPVNQTDSPSASETSADDRRENGQQIPGVEHGQDYLNLCQKFLTLVNCRNPILDPYDLLTHARAAAKDGLGWDGRSCLVLLACALASFSRAWTPPSPLPSASSTPSTTPAPRRASAVPANVMLRSDDKAAAAYFEAAQRRLGGLGTSLIDIQCFYFACSFEKFAFRPVQAWMHLQQAATRLRLHHMERIGKEKRRGEHGTQAGSCEDSPSSISHHFEQRAFWSIHKAEREFATELGMTLASDLTSFEYPASFPTPPETLNNLVPSDDGGADDNGVVDSMMDVFSPRRNEFIWFFYLAQISLRRTLDEVLSVVYEKGEQHWLEDIDLVCRQYHESQKQIAEWQSHLPPAMRYDPAAEPNNEMGYYLLSRFAEWKEAILRPLVYYCLHQPREEPPTASIVSLAQRYMALCVDCIERCSVYDRHGGTWFVLRRAFRCTLVMLATVVADGPLQPPRNWEELSRTMIETLGRWSAGVRDLQRMERVLQRVLNAVCELKGYRG